MPPRKAFHRINDLDLCVWEWPGAGAPIVLCHATSFHARCWDRVIGRLRGRRCFAPDARGHGQSGKSEPPYHWRRFGEDLAALLEELPVEGGLGVGHSMGAYSVALAAALNPSKFSKLVLLDPVILPAEAYRGPAEPLESVLRRKNTWHSTEQMFNRFKDRDAFSRWDRQVLRDYCEHGLNGPALACPPVVEASIYAHSTEESANIYSEIKRIDVPVLVVRSPVPYIYGQFETSPAAPDVASKFRRGVDMVLPDASHFIPMEAPDLTANLILDFDESRIS